MEEILKKRGYAEKQAKSAATELALIDPRLKEALGRWLEDETETDFSVEGFSILGLKEKYEMTYPAALLSIDWILKEPELAISCINKGIR